MKNLLIILLALTSVSVMGQKKIVKQITAEVKKADYKSHIYFLASDEMRGRNTATQENEIAARYIAEQMRASGVTMAPGQDTYFQQVELVKTMPPARSTLTVGDSVFNVWDDMIFISAKNVNLTGEMMYVDFGFPEDLEGKDVKGKILIAKAGNGDPSKGSYKFSFQKFAAARDAGALALIELYRPSRIPWKLLTNYLSGNQFSIDEGQDVEAYPACWLVDKDGSGRLDYFKSMEGKLATLYVAGSGRIRVKVPNVVGVIEGTDPELKNDHIMISAHFDHVGVKAVAEEDSIWNGARDNGIGVANMLTTAKYFSEHPPKRSIVFLACNAEEVGLLGSQWYADHPLIPLENTVFNLNTDTGGYDDISKVTIVGFNRTSVTPFLVEGAEMFGLEAIDDTFPEENFYDRSDNVSFAAKGVPAISYGPGVVEMGAAITDFYHQPTDEPNTLDYDYLIKFSRAYIYTLNKIANTDGELWWTAGDKYEEAGKALYGK
ncbi:MAG: M28 family peptidase [Cyclobacteriaceae bacterium]